jgi:hypothetical protein
MQNEVFILDSLPGTVIYCAEFEKPGETWWVNCETIYTTHRWPPAHLPTFNSEFA